MQPTRVHLRAPLIDGWMPAFDARTQHHIRVAAPADRVWAALRDADLGRHPLVRTLLLLRAAPLAIVRRARWRRLRADAARPLTLAAFEAHGFRMLEELAPQELVIGLEGAFWKPGGGLRPVDPATFRGPPAAGLARVAWNFVIEPVDDDTCMLWTETRIATGDAAARRRFRIYWLIVRPGSNIIRRLMLRTIRMQAEAGPAGATGADTK